MDTPRVLPQSLEAEKCVLGACLINNQAIDVAEGVLAPGDFFRQAHQMAFACILELRHRRVAVDLVTLKDALDHKGQLADAGGPAYLSSLTDGMPRSANTEYHARIVKEAAQRRSLIATGNQMVDGAYNKECAVEDVTRDADRAILDLTGAASDRLVDIRSAAADLFESIKWHCDHAGQIIGLDTGYPQINALTSGWLPADLVVVAAKSSMGKSAFLLNMAGTAARQGKHVVICSLEMRRRQMEYRLLANLSGVDGTRIRDGYLGDEDFSRIGTAMSTLSDCPIWMEDRAGQSAATVRGTARRVRGESGRCDLVIVDYLQLMAPSYRRRDENTVEELSDNVERLKNLADELACPIILASQLNRKETDNRRPNLASLRGSDAIGQYADIVSFLHRDSHKASGLTEFIIEKQRNGPVGTVPLWFDRHTQTFREATEEECAPKRAEPEGGSEDAPKPPRGWRKRPRRD